MGNGQKGHAQKTSIKQMKQQCKQLQQIKSEPSQISVINTLTIISHVCQDFFYVWSVFHILNAICSGAATLVMFLVKSVPCLCMWSFLPPLHMSVCVCV